MTTRCGAASLAAALAVAVFAVPSAAQKPKNNQEQRDNARVRDARKDVDQARGKVNDAQKSVQSAAKELTQAEAKEKAAVRRIQDARDKAEERLGKGVGLDKALADLKEAQVAFDKARAPVIEALKKSPEYLAAVKHAGEAMEKLRALRGAGSQADKSQTAELTKQSLAAGQLEQRAVENDTAAAAAHQRLTDLQQKVSTLRDKIRKDVESDAGVKSARDEADSARDAAKRAQETVAKERRDLAQAQQKLAQEQAQLQKAEIQDKRNDGKKK